MVRRRDVFVSRRRILSAFLFGTIALRMSDRTATAAATLTKEMAGYKTQPSGRKSCADCSHFIPGGKPEEDGRCAVVEGAISPHGSCTVWSPRKPVEGC